MDVVVVALLLRLEFQFPIHNSNYVLVMKRKDKIVICQLDKRKSVITSVCIEAKIAIVLYLPRKESARKPPSKQRRKLVPMKSVTMLAEAALGRCNVPTK